MDWTKSTYRRHIEARLRDELATRGYRPVRGEHGAVRTIDPDGEVLASVRYQVTTANQPPTVIGIHPSAAIRLASVAARCAALFERDPSTATIGADLGAFTPSDSATSEYRLDWSDPSDTAFHALVADIDRFDSFAGSIRSVHDLGAARLARIPTLRRNFAGGLGESYKYTTPEVAAVIHHLTGDRERAVAALALAGRLTDDQRAAVAALIGA